MKKIVIQPPLRDAQQEPPQWYCRSCGQEQYRTDRCVLRRGRRLCRRCARAERRGERYVDAV